MIAVFYLGGGWYFAGEVHKSALAVATYDPAAIETGTVTAVDISVDGTGSITVTRDPVSAEKTKNNEVVVGLKVGDEILLAGPATEVSGAVVTRPVIEATTTPAVGDPVGLVRDIWLQPDQAGMDYTEVMIDGPLGPLPAWWIKGSDSEKWAVLTHGKGASRSEMLRMSRTLSEAGFNMVVCSYRNDAGTAASEDGMVRYGATEWEDLQACVRWALDRGAQRLVLGGASHGAAVTLGFMAKSELADQVDALIFDSPAASLPDVIDAAADFRTIPVIGTAVPESLQSVALWMTSWRYGVDMQEVDYPNMVGLITVPTLVIQGEDDETTPLLATDHFVAAFPEHITYVRVPGADHVLSWNVDPQKYDDAVRDFLTSAGLR